MTSWQQREMDRRTGNQLVFTSLLFAAAAVALGAIARSPHILQQAQVPGWLAIFGAVFCGLLWLICLISGARMVAHANY